MRISWQLRSERREANGINRERSRSEKTVEEEKSKRYENAEGAEKTVSPYTVTESDEGLDCDPSLFGAEHAASFLSRFGPRFPSQSRSY